MATRNDITVSQYLSPRVAEVAQPSTEVVMQDYVDTLRSEEDDFRSMSFAKLIDASGKEDLGGGVLVGITVSEQNVQLAFEPNVTPVHIGTVTTASGPPSAVGRMQFTDSTADFVADGVQPGSFVINFTDNSVVDIVRVISTDTLETRTLANGLNNEFDFGDVIHVFNIRQCTTSGGNLVAVDENDVAISAILPTAFTQVVLQTSSSATIQELTEIRYSAYQNAVWYQASSGNSGTAYPNGTPLQPLDNIPDCVAVATALGFRAIRIIGDVTLDTGDVLANLRVIGDDPALTTIYVNGAADVTNTQFTEATLTGVLDGGSVIRNCVIQPPLSFVEGVIRECLLEAGTITLSGSADVEFLDCWSGVAGSSTPTIDYGGSGRDLMMRNYSGGIQIINKSGADAVSIDLVSGQVKLEATVTAGEIVIRGSGELIDNSTGTTTVASDGLLNNEAISSATWDALIVNHNVTGSFGEFIVRRLLTVAKFFALR